MLQFFKNLWPPPSGKKFRTPRPHPAGLGTFLGVFTPTILTILGVIMYLRFGWVVGEVGIGRALIIVAMANLITLITSLCLSAVATNTRVGVGGAYFIISRSLGVDIGAAIGFPLFLSQALSVTLYSFGLAESLRIVWPGVPIPAATVVIIALVTALAFRGAGVALRTQLPVMVLIALSVLALALGVLTGSAPEAAQATAPAQGADFWLVFAVFFPAVTGIMAGLSLSGDLADPRKSIPKGTILATLTGFAVYLLIPVLLFLGSDAETLRTEPLVWTRIAILGPWLILPGLWGAIFSSAVGSMLAAPRTLQALLSDFFPSKQPVETTNGNGKTKEPIFGLVVTLILALGAVLLGNLNAVAAVVTMFFLTVYGTINLVAALEKLSGNPSWRPRVDVPWPVSLTGALACFAVMTLINFPATAAALATVLALWLLLKRRVRKEHWGDVRRDVYEALIRWALIRLSARPMTARNWRPHVLVFVSDVERRLDLVRYGSWFSEDRGIVTVCELVEGDLLQLDLDIMKRQKEIEAILRRKGIVAFGEVDVVQNVERGIITVAQASGIAGIESNTVLLGWPDESDRQVHFLRVIRPLKRLGISLIIGRLQPLALLREGKRRTIHIWWGGLQRNGDLMLLLSFLLTRNVEWRGSQIRILSLASSQIMKDATERFLNELIPEIRIAAEVDVMINPEGASVKDVILRKSGGADLVMLGLAMPEEGDEENHARRLSELTENLPSCFLVHNGSLFIGELVST
jgi:solute carrier family 12 (potassium/chloride transporter), member 4/6